MVNAGLTVIALPFPADIPPQEELYQYQFAAVPKLPPVIPKIVELPSQIDGKVAVTMLAEVVEESFTVMVIFTQVVVLQIPSALK